MKKTQYLLSVLIALLAISCDTTDDFLSNENVVTKLEINPTLGLSSTKATPISYFEEGDEMGLYIEDKDGNPYNDNSSNIKFTYINHEWVSNISTFLDGRDAYIYAYYPYNNSRENTVERIEISAFYNDFLMGKTVQVNNRHTTIQIRMKHALALVVYNIKRGKYPNTGNITYAGIQTVSSGGWMNLKTQNFEQKPYYYSNSGTYYEKGELILPFSQEQITAEVLVLPHKALDVCNYQFKIDNVYYYQKVDSNTIWESGKKYIYDVTVNGIDIEISPSSQIQEWGGGFGMHWNMFESHFE